jgi:hypothetical protein
LIDSTVTIVIPFVRPFVRTDFSDIPFLPRDDGGGGDAKQGRISRRQRPREEIEGGKIAAKDIGGTTFIPSS